MGHPLRVGLIGAGNISAAHLPGYRHSPQRVTLCAIADTLEPNARRRAAETGVEWVFTDPERMIHDAKIDAVDICTTHASHAPLAIAALEAGKHVIVEKPMAINPRQCLDMVAAAEKSGATLMVAQCQRFEPSYVTVRKIISSGALGEIRAVRFDAMQRIAAFITPGHWLFDASITGGGIVISVLVHRIDLMRYLIGDVHRVTATCKTLDPMFINGAEDVAAITMEFSCGAMGQAFAAWSSMRHPWSESFMIMGSRGTVHAVPDIGEYIGPAFVAIDGTAPPVVEWNDQFRGWSPVGTDQGSLPTDNSFTNEILHFADCCASGREPVSSGRDNLGTMGVVFAAYESARTHKPVDVAEVMR